MITCNFVAASLTCALTQVESRFEASMSDEITGHRDQRSVTDARQIHKVGIFASIKSMVKQDDPSRGTVVVFMAHRRIQLASVTQIHPTFIVKVKHIEEKPQHKLQEQDRDTVKAYTLEIMGTIKDILSRNPLFKEQLQLVLNNADLSKPSLLADYAAGLTSASGGELQEILETFDLKNRLRKCLILLKKELEISKLQATISKQVENNLNKKQREYFLHEQLRSIKRELGMEKDDKDSLAQKYRDRLNGRKIPDAVMCVINEELDKLQMLETSSMEFNITGNYLDWLTIMPHGIVSEENFDISHAENILKEDHYGLEDVKERILEFIAVGNLMGSVAQGKIICLVGPPGVGKTSIGKSIARALGRRFFRFSVGGMTDVAEIKGHRRTYVGAMPGKFVQCLKKTQTSNPVILIDEIDKVGQSRITGDPSSALLEALDPEQNNSFMDHYMDVPVDLSKVLFICTANAQEQISRPLADRMDFIRLSGYVWQEKLHIARQFLEPLTATRTGVDSKKILITDGAIEKLVRSYCREAGVRNLQKHIEKIYRKVALRLVRGESTKSEVTDQNLSDFVGESTFSAVRMYDSTPAGVVMGLAWNSMGGSTLYIESAVSEVQSPAGLIDSPSSDMGYAGLFVTGMMGDVMKESSQIAYTVAKRVLRDLDPKNPFFANNRIHLHVPEGATPKDGPSAGITMVTSLLSLATGKPVCANIAMTGEITLTGKVLAIGGVKEKTIAARRSLVTRVIFPLANKKDVEVLPDFVKEGMTFFYADFISDVYDITLRDEVG